MDASTLGLIATGLVAFFIIWSIFFGIIRGFGKSLFRLVWLVGTLVILFFLMPTISNAVCEIDISSIIPLSFGGQPINKIKDIGVNLLNEFAKDSEIIKNNQYLQGFLQGLPSMVVSLILFVVLFWLTKWLLWGLWALISSKIFKKKVNKKAERKRKKELLEQYGNNYVPPYQPEIPPPKKHRVLGGLVGLVIGIIISGATLMPLIGFNSIILEVNAIKTTSNGEQVPVLEKVVGDKNTIEILSFYEDSIANKILTYTGASALSNLTFNELAVVNVKTQRFDDKLYMNKEIPAIFGIYGDIDNLMNGDDFSIKTIGRVLDKITGRSSSGGSVFCKNVSDSFVMYFIDQQIEDNGLSQFGVFVESIKQNLANIESYETEFSHIESLINVIGRNYATDKEKFSTIGQKIDDILFENNSKILTRGVINTYVKKEIDSLISGTSLDAELKNNFYSIKNNVDNIESYKTELELAFELKDIMNKQTKDLEAIGDKFDYIISKNSKLITKNIINDIVVNYFDGEVKKFSTDTNYTNILSKMRNNVVSMKTKPNAKYKTLFNELNKVTTYISDFQKINSEETFKANTTMGAHLDEMEKMTTACNGETTYLIAKVIFDTLLDNLTKTGKQAIRTRIENDPLNNNEFDFKTYKYKFDNDPATTFNGTYGTTPPSSITYQYYTDLIAQIKAKLILSV